ncbi:MULTISPECIES: APC family permease [Haloferax]|uniref:Amino acid transporter n=2 Tax=Haloferax gibbonsii TaxID=35746 RepID=A0A0K1IZ76_HALGI|nr:MULTISPECIES: APC family permease [Haloferax]AKU09761.1 amino acid transporter [Haloferax gibbonsii]ELZ75751.1 cationic amino acid transporter [Haloferax gibbonsii ATCC 33959]QOS13850.1 transport protein (probable substrate cationic amino acids) [Haloferax gibbonsii]RDZ50841.1 APC family permease [Haloferax sp. Atlit-4N]REA01491.1 APC family permease [Haloferax sp. Atlit-6N]
MSDGNDGGSVLEADPPGEGGRVGDADPAVDVGAAADEVTVLESGTELERTIGLRGGLAIGIGTMVGAGIFVFPGLAAGQAGPAAALSFALGAVIALLVALPTSELATAMPKSGGAYYFISRGMGSAFGAVVGIGLWLGLVFASAFYLVGFAQYAIAVLTELGAASMVSDLPLVAVLGVGFGVVLTALSMFGTENATKLQNSIVSLLLGILLVFLVYGSLDTLGLFGRQTVPEEFMPYGTLSIFTTAALVFTSYLGFAQVATVAGEITKPGRNLPLAMVGSVVVVGVLYVVTILVSTGAFGSGRLATFGETAIVEVARSYLGFPGAVAILIAGLLATVSSANASILSSSRALYALSRDALVPPQLARINLRYGTPHVALALVGGPTVVLVAVGRTEVLAEVASFLHLVTYGLICVALIGLRRSNPAWYDPSFRVPGYPVVPVLGALASFSLVAFMQPLSQAVGVVVALAALVWYFVYARDVRLKGVSADA